MNVSASASAWRNGEVRSRKDRRGIWVVAIGLLYTQCKSEPFNDTILRQSRCYIYCYSFLKYYCMTSVLLPKNSEMWLVIFLYHVLPLWLVMLHLFYLPCEHFNGRNSLLYHLIYPHFAWVVTRPIMLYGAKNRHKKGLSSKSPKFDDSISISLSWLPLSFSWAIRVTRSHSECFFAHQLFDLQFMSLRTLLPALWLLRVGWYSTFVSLVVQQWTYAILHTTEKNGIFASLLHWFFWENTLQATSRTWSPIVEVRILRRVFFKSHCLHIPYVTSPQKANNSRSFFQNTLIFRENFHLTASRSVVSVNWCKVACGNVGLMLSMCEFPCVFSTSNHSLESPETKFHKFWKFTERVSV